MKTLCMSSCWILFMKRCPIDTVLVPKGINIETTYNMKGGESYEEVFGSWPGCDDDGIYVFDSICSQQPERKFEQPSQQQ